MNKVSVGDIMRLESMVETISYISNTNEYKRLLLSREDDDAVTAASLILGIEAVSDRLSHVLARYRNQLEMQK